MCGAARVVGKSREVPVAGALGDRALGPDSADGRPPSSPARREAGGALHLCTHRQPSSPGARAPRLLHRTEVSLDGVGAAPIRSSGWRRCSACAEPASAEPPPPRPPAPSSWSGASPRRPFLRGVGCLGAGGPVPARAPAAWEAESCPPRELTLAWPGVRSSLAGGHLRMQV